MFSVSGLCIVFLNILTSSSHEIDGILAKLIVDITSSLYASSTFTAFLCCSAANRFELSKFMSKNYKAHEIFTISVDYKLDEAWSALSYQNFYVLDLNCPSSYELLVQANKNRLFVAPTKWLILQDSRAQTDSSMNKSLEELFGEFDVFPDSEVIIGERNDNVIVSLLSVYRPRSDRNIVIENRGFWRDGDGLQLRDYHASSRRRIDLQQISLKAPIVLVEPDTMNNLDYFDNKRIDAPSIVCHILAKLLVARMNASVTYTHTSSWGFMQENGTWTGMMAEILYNDCDFSASGSFMTPARLNIVEYLHLHVPTRMKFIFRKPPLSYVSNLFMRPFAANVWIASITFCCLGLTVLYISMAWEWEVIQRSDGGEKLAGDIQNKPKFGDNFLIVIGAITQQGSSYEPRTNPARTVIFMLLILCLSLYAAYTAKIVALLQSSSDSIKNSEDLMNSSLKLGLHDIVYNRYYFKSFEDPHRKEFYERRIKNHPDVWMSVEDGIQKLRNELFAFHVDRSLGYNIILQTFGEDEKCGLKEIDLFGLPDPAFSIKLQSPYRELFRVGAVMLEERGLKQRIVERMYNKKPQCQNLNAFLSVGVVECYAAYITMGYGIALTLVILLIEIIWSKRCDNVDTQDEDLEEGSTSFGDTSEFDENSDNRIDSMIV